MKIIKKLSPSRFQVSTEGVVGSDLTLDFAPLIKEHNLSGDYFLIHFQAKPKIHRQWGIYSGKDDSYISVADIVTSVDDRTYAMRETVIPHYGDNVRYLSQLMWSSLSRRIYQFLNNISLQECIEREEEGESITDIHAGLLQSGLTDNFADFREAS